MKYCVVVGALVVGACSGFTSGGAAPGQLFCAVATAAGPLVVTVLDAAGVPFLVTGLAQGVVAGACKAWNPAAVPVSPATVPVPSVAIPVR